MSGVRRFLSRREKSPRPHGHSHSRSQSQHNPERKVCGILIPFRSLYTSQTASGVNMFASSLSGARWKLLCSSHKRDQSSSDSRTPVEGSESEAQSMSHGSPYDSVCGSELERSGSLATTKHSSCDQLTIWHSCNAFPVELCSLANP